MNEIFATLFDLHQIKFFSWEGLVAVIAIVIPNFLFLKRANPTRPNDIDNAGDKPIKMEFWMRFLLNFVVPLIRTPHILEPQMFYVCCGLLAIYFVLWIKFAVDGYYYPDIYMKRFLGIPIPFDIVNSLYFICVSFWLGNAIALGMSILFAVAKIQNAVAAMNDLNSREE